ncbi:DUF6482 family protein [Mangrovitalea sediminis]|uniref:DUF6482 family protein n=1 Tax=Mangrovitalea sediminis TaxID=1982043 RepID=UPI000BE4BF24|nr:DUF6482 family protein [Mangrovitalea sediminis]
MRITLDQLQPLSTGIDCLEILSLEGQRYVARLWIDGQPALLSDAKQQTCLFRSAWEAQNLLREIPIGETVVVHQAAYNEMVGLDEHAVAPLRIRLRGKS